MPLADYDLDLIALGCLPGWRAFPHTWSVEKPSASETSAIPDADVVLRVPLERDQVGYVAYWDEDGGIWGFTRDGKRRLVTAGSVPGLFEFPGLLDYLTTPGPDTVVPFKMALAYALTPQTS